MKRLDRHSLSLLRPFKWSRTGAYLAVVILMFLNIGCGTRGTLAGGSPAELHLFAVPSAIQVGERPIVDGIGVRIYASAAGKAQGVPLRSGRLEIVMFDGTPSMAGMRSIIPVHIWAFSAPELVPFVATSTLGTGYQLALSWGTTPPSGKVVTVIARYYPVRGAELVSTANTIAIKRR